MAIIKCRECGAEISSDSRFCPKCGKPSFEQEKLLKTQESNAGSARAMWVIVGIILIIVGIFISSGSCSIGLV